MARFLTDEHVPVPFIAVLGSLGHGVVRAKDELEEGARDGRLPEFAKAGFAAELRETAANGDDLHLFTVDDVVGMF